MSFTFDRRAATEDERSVLGRPWLPPSVYALLMAAIALLMYFIAAVLFLLTSVTLINAFIGDWLNDQLPRPVAMSPWMEPLLITVLWGPVFLVPLWISVRRFNRLRRERQGAWADLKHGEVEWIRIEDEPFRALWIGEERLHLVFDLPQGGALLISDQTLYHSICEFRAMDRMEALEEPTQEQIDAILDQEMPVFPARIIELRRWPGAGHVTHLQGWDQLPTGPSYVLSPAHIKRGKHIALRDSVILPLQCKDLVLLAK